MIKGFSVPLTPSGLASMVPTPPWYYVGNTMGVEFVADVNKIAPFLPEGLEPLDGRCAIYFCDWQTASGEQPEAYLNPTMSQYKEAALIMSCQYEGKPAAFCPFIWVDNDGAAMRGQVYGYPKQIAQIGITRTFHIESKAAPQIEAGGKLGAYAAADCGRLFEMQLTLEEPCSKLPYPHFAHVIGLRHFPNLNADEGYKPSVKDLVVGVGGENRAADGWCGSAKMRIYWNSCPELEAFEPISVGTGYYSVDSHTMYSMKVLRDLR